MPDPKYIGGDIPGFFGALHTWGRQLQYHPHIHYIVPGGAVTKKDGEWYSSRDDFYLPVKALSKIFKAKFCDNLKVTREMKKAGRKTLKEVCDVEFIKSESETKPEILCPDCGGKLKYYYSILPCQMIPADTG